MGASRWAATACLAAVCCMTAIPASADPTARGRILLAILSQIVCCTTDMQFTKPAHSKNVPANLGLGVAPGVGAPLVQLGQVARGNDGKPILKGAYALDASCKPVPVEGKAIPPMANLFTLGEIASLKPKHAPEELWPVVNATFQSTLLQAMKLATPPARHTCLRQHLERVIHGEEGTLR